jgi:hypothetical protein
MGVNEPTNIFLPSTMSWRGMENHMKKETNVNHGAVHFKSQSMLFGSDQAFANGTAWWDDITVL